MTRKATNTGRELEQRVADAYRAMGARRVDHDVELAGNQIDVYVELGTPGRLLHRIAVEVKDQSRPVGVKIVNNFAQVVDLLRRERVIDRGVIVSASGFSRPARNAAQTYDIRLLEPKDLDAMVTEAQAAGSTQLTTSPVPPRSGEGLESERVAQKGAISLPSADTDTPFLNPFRDRGRINDPTRFFNRKRILRELRQMLGAGNSVSLVGEQEIGKSSLLCYLDKTQTEWIPNARVLFLDLQRVLDEEDFGVEVLEGLGYEPGDLGALKRALKQGHTVLLLDEAEVLADRAFFPRLHDLLRALAQEPTLTLAVASHRPLVEVFPPSDPTSPFHNIFTPKRLGPFSPGEARALLNHRLKGTGIDFTPEEVAQLVRESSCHPARLQRLAYDLFEQKRR